MDLHCFCPHMLPRAHVDLTVSPARTSASFCARAQAYACRPSSPVVSPPHTFLLSVASRLLPPLPSAALAIPRCRPRPPMHAVSPAACPAEPTPAAARRPRLATAPTSSASAHCDGGCSHRAPSSRQPSANVRARSRCSLRAAAIALAAAWPLAAVVLAAVALLATAVCCPAADALVLAVALLAATTAVLPLLYASKLRLLLLCCVAAVYSS
nr:uncharacterized protein LOC109755953 [Aegilops tauschii subsp. strangulata]